MGLSMSTNRSRLHYGNHEPSRLLKTLKTHKQRVNTVQNVKKFSHFRSAGGPLIKSNESKSISINGQKHYCQMYREME